MTEETKSQRKESLNRRFNSGQSEEQDEASSSKASKTSKTEKTTSSNKTEREQSNERPSVREKKALTMYLYEDQTKQLDRQFQRLNLNYQDEFDEKIEKNADFYPAVLEAAFTEQTVKDVLWDRDTEGDDA